MARKAGPVGRGDVLAELRRVVDEAVAGRGHLLLLAESRIQPLLLLLDDLQWADQPSQLLLDFLARRLPAGSMAVVGGYRDTEPVPARCWPRWRRGPPCCR